jgi:hypothetical protein
VPSSTVIESESGENSGRSAVIVTSPSWMTHLPSDRAGTCSTPSSGMACCPSVPGRVPMPLAASKSSEYDLGVPLPSSTVTFTWP